MGLINFDKLLAYMAEIEECEQNLATGDLLPVS